MRALFERILALAFLLLLAPAAGAQVIPIKTVPVATGDQFLVFPSDRLGMASVSIAVQDTTGDPFANPATLGRLDGGLLFSAPTAYGITGGNGGAMTLPAGAFLGSSEWRGAFALALQELDRGGQRWGVWPAVDVAVVPDPNQLDQRSRTNLYAFGAVARSLGEAGRTTVGASLSVADLGAVGGVDLLYAQRPVDQRGSLLDLRLGLETEAAGGAVLEAVLIHARLDMEHDLIDWVWVPMPQPALPPEQWPWQRRAVERTEEDRTSTWGLHVGYSRPLRGDDGWTAGAIATLNYKAHPKLPNYTLMSIPRDPGDTWAYDLGVGIAKRTETAEFALDLIYEPIWTETWADAPEPVMDVHGDIIAAGDLTVLNDFRFNNAILRMGLAGRMDRLDVRFGLQLKRYGYTLDQTDFLLDRRRRHQEDWLEWTPALGFALRFRDFTLSYSGRITTGTGRPGVAATPVTFAVPDASALSAVDFIPAPSGALTLDEATVHTHQIAVSIPFGG